MKTLVPVLFLVLLTSCDPGVVNKFVVENRTDSEIKIESILKSGNRNITETDTIHIVELSSQTKSFIVEYGEIGSAHDKGINFLEGIDTLIIKSEYKTLNKNIFDRNNWTFKVIKIGFFTMDEVEYQLTLTEKYFK
jgi:hypothetical protein